MQIKNKKQGLHFKNEQKCNIIKIKRSPSILEAFIQIIFILQEQFYSTLPLYLIEQYLHIIFLYIESSRIRIKMESQQDSNYSKEFIHSQHQNEFIVFNQQKQENLKEQFHGPISNDSFITTKIPAKLLYKLRYSSSKISKSLPSNEFVNQQKKQQQKSEYSEFSCCCLICCSHLNVSKKPLLMTDCEHKHSFCQSCLHHYVIYKVNTYQQIYCPYQNCQSILHTNNAFFKQLPLEIQNKYFKNKQKDTHNIEIDQITCPHQNQGNKMKCTICKLQLCGKHLQQSHNGDCLEDQSSFLQEIFDYQRCKRCKTIIQKISGCNHMKCVCGFQFCYICGQNWEDIHYTLHSNAEPIALDSGSQMYCLRYRPYFSCKWFDEMCGQTVSKIVKIPLKIILFSVLIILKMLVFIGRDFLYIIGILLTCLIAGVSIFSISLLCKLKSWKFIAGIVFFPVMICLGIKYAIQLLADVFRNYWLSYKHQIHQIIISVSLI